jgi:predicted acyl esterase
MALSLSGASARDESDPVADPPPTSIAHITARDGTVLAAALHLPSASGRFPTLFAASPYRFDNDTTPADPIFLQNEKGPIAWYLEQGYAFVHMDVRGTGRSGGEYRYFSREEQTDLYDAIEWIARQPWSNGNVGGIGQSYYARTQWMMGIQNPPHLKCIAPYDGDVDTYRFSAYNGGVPGDYPSSWYNTGPRYINRYPANGPSRRLDWDYAAAAADHPLYDDFWRERAAIDRLDRITVPVYSIGVWGKMSFALNGNLWGYQLTRAPKKLLVVGAGDVAGAVAEYTSVAFHERYMLPFYDHFLKGRTTSYVREPPVRYFVQGADAFEASETWPPRGIAPRSYYLAAGPTGSVVSLNDGGLGITEPAAGGGSTSYTYPNPGWQSGVVGNGPDGERDPVRRVLTFTTAPLEADLRVVGPIELELYASSTRPDAVFVVKLSEQLADATHTERGIQNPRSHIVSKGWLRAALRRIDPARSLPNAPYYPFDREEPLVPGRVERFVIAMTPTAYVFRKGHRIRLEIVNGDSPVTDGVWTHTYGPRLVGTDTIHHDATRPSRLILPIAPA